MAQNLGTYFVCFQDFGRAGREAIVDPELTRSNIIDRIRARDFGFDSVIAVHECAVGEIARDVTDEIFAAAQAPMILMAAE